MEEQLSPSTSASPVLNGRPLPVLLPNGTRGQLHARERKKRLRKGTFSCTECKFDIAVTLVFVLPQLAKFKTFILTFWDTKAGEERFAVFLHCKIHHSALHV
jgi:hypothetical protein